VVDGGGEAVTEDIFTDSFVNEVYGAGEGAVYFGDDFSAIALEEDGSLTSLISTDGLGADVEVWAGGEWESFESEVAIDVDAAAQPAIIDNAAFAADAGAAEADTEDFAQRQAQRAIQQAFANFF
jgi:hypothetical protein